MLNNLRGKVYNFLRWSEKYTKTDMIYLIEGSAWLTSGQVISTASSFLLAVVFANFLSKETYGIYTYVLSATAIFSIPTLSGMMAAIIQTVARGYEGSTIPAIRAKIKWGLLGSLASVIFAGYYFFSGNISLAISFLIVAVFLPFMDAFTIYDAVLQGKKFFDLSVKYFIITQIIAALSLAATVFFTKNIFLILLVYFTSWTLMRFICLKFTLRKFPPEQAQDDQAISYGKHLSLMGIMGTIADSLDQLLIFHYLGAAELAIYFFALAPTEQIKGLLKSISTLALPKFSQHSKEEIKKTIMGKIFKYSLLIGIIIVVYILAAPLIFKIFFPKYLSSVFYSQILAVSLISAAATPLYYALQAQTAKKELYLCNTIASLLQIILLFVFLYFFGLMGAVLARLFTRFLIMFFLVFLVKKI